MKTEQSKGLGDTIAKVTSAVGIKPCSGCEKRREALNRMFPYAKTDAEVDSALAEHAALAQRTAQALRSQQCSCGAPKERGMVFCPKCLERLSADQRSALRRPMGDGLEAAYQDAAKQLA